MFTLGLNNTIQLLVDHELDRKTEVRLNDDSSLTRPGVCIEVNVRADHYTDKDDRSSFRSFYMLFHGHTSVYYVDRMDSEGRRRYLREIDPSEWANTSNHDSCWRSDGFSFLSDAYFTMCKEVAPDIAPVEVNTSTDLGLGMTWPVTQVSVTFKHKSSGYGNEILSIKEVV